MHKDDILLKKWELLWNHYKLQNEYVEKRRYFLWIVQVFIFTGWYKFYDKYSEVAQLLSLVGIIISIIWIFVLKRERRSILITEHALREVEVEWNNLRNDVELNRFILDKKLLYKRGEHTFKYEDDKISKPRLFDKFSASWIFNNIIPSIIASFWVILIYFTSGARNTYILLVLIFLILGILFLIREK
jgi:hypothetical protein